MSEAQVISEQISAAVAFYDRGDMAQAMAVLKPLIEQHPDVAWALNVAGNCARAMGDLDSAENYLRRALAQHPRYVQAYNNLGIVLRELRRFSEAEAAFRQAIEINGGDYGNGRLNLAMLLLYMGRLAEGWPYFESRYHDLPRGCPQWHGEPLAGKSILVCHEQGFGDQIQFIRYLPHLKAMGASRVTIMCDAVLWPLLESADGANEVLDADVVDVKEKASAHDFWVQLLSLPLLLGTTLASIPATVPYLKVPQRRLARWESQLPAGGLRVGLVWKGRAAHVNDRYRSLPGLQALAPLWAVQGVHFVSLQKFSGEDEATNPPPEQPLISLGGQINDFADSAAIVAQLDLVISVDTAIAHLAGALGKPCWVLLSRMGTDWRWMAERADSPWYPTMRLFRQARPNDWNPLVSDVVAALKMFVQKMVGQESAP